MRGLIFYVPEAMAAEPANGEAIVNAWWTVHPEKGVAFYMDRRRSPFLEPGEREDPSPQCNQEQATAEHIQRRLYPDCITKQIPVVFTAHALREMRRQRELALSSGQ
jgi:hypothetical protein